MTEGPAIDPPELANLVAGRHPEPHRLLGAHPAVVSGVQGIVVRTFHPDAAAVELLEVNGTAEPFTACGSGVFSIFLPGAHLPHRYRLRFHFSGGAIWERGDPYRFLPTLGELDLHLFNEGAHHRLWEALGAHPRTIDGEAGVAFAVWAPNALRVSVIGDFCRWDGRLFPMRRLGNAGVFELFVPGAREEQLYKFELVTREGALRVKADPMAQAAERRPGTASRIRAPSRYAWGDAGWLAQRHTCDARRAPMWTYEVHLGSWRRVPEEGDRMLTYREVAPLLAAHCRRFGFTHVELLPIMEHPFDGSWGYQATSYYAPTARFGDPDDFRFLVDTLHQAGIGVLLDWAPAHFPKDDFALRRFDGTALYEHDDPRLGEHPDWGTLVFNYGRPEVRGFLIGNALYWIEEFHVDGLRVDAVASMLYLDYSRREGEWLPNRYGGRENLDAITFLRALNDTIAAVAPGTIVVAEESTSWSGVTRPTASGGLGFTFKWNMGWMHDTLRYFSRDPIHRRHHHNELTFAMLYEYSEAFVNPLSHDEVVHGKRSLLEKMPGDVWRRLATLRALLVYQVTRPGKGLVFMGTELAPWAEWDHDRSLDWHLADDPPRAAFARFLAELGRLYHAHPCLWRSDPDPEGFAWIDCTDRDASVVSYARWDGESHLVVVFNLTPVPREDYRIGVPRSGGYRELLSSDRPDFGGSEFTTLGLLPTEPVPYHRQPCSVRLRLPPLGALILAPEAG